MELRVFSAVQPTGRLHLGNYLGALRGFVSLQNTHTAFYAAADLHALTLPQDPAQLRAAVHHTAAGFLACGVDPERSCVFAQSRVPGHARLGWIMTCLATMGRLNRMTQFKEKSGKNREEVSAGLYVYPALMAADVLLYRATHVPVGDDQKQHLELARDLAQKFNLTYGDTFPLPEPLTPPDAARVMSLREGTAKMSKSDPSEYSRIHLDDSDDEIRLKIRRAKTDPLPLPVSEEAAAERPEALNLLRIYAALQKQPLAAVIAQFADTGFAGFKEQLAEVLIAHLAPIRERLLRFKSDPGALEAILTAGAERAAAAAEPTLARVHEVLGL